VIDPLYVRFPGLQQDGYVPTSPSDVLYNCVAHAAAQPNRWWWPTGRYFWPPGIRRAESIDAFISAFRTLGYAPCADGDLQPDLEKVAIYAKNGKPTHVARQLPSGRWTSKLGDHIDIEHATPGALAGNHYGHPVQFMERRRRQ
jgi:hypothetical protein